MEMLMDNLFVLGLGLATVFVGLICNIIICNLMSALCSGMGQKPVQPTVAVPAAAAPSAPEASPNRQEMIAAVAAAVAEEMGTDVSKIRILSMQKI